MTIQESILKKLQEVSPEFALHAADAAAEKADTAKRDIKFAKEVEDTDLEAKSKELASDKNRQANKFVDYAMDKGATQQEELSFTEEEITEFRKFIWESIDLEEAVPFKLARDLIAPATYGMKKIIKKPKLFTAGSQFQAIKKAGEAAKVGRLAKYTTMVP